MTDFTAIQRTFESKMQLAATPETVFPLLCPVREYDWIPHWECEMVWSRSGVAEEGCIFNTHFPDRGGKETWVVCRYEPPETIAFVRFNANIATRYTIRLTEEAGATVAVWSQIQTGLTETGNCIIAEIPLEAYDTLMKSLEARLNHYLTTGEMLAGDMAH